jgi:Holliday junction resolvasome RuvABC ATP-dependent DNA helicase subunit
MLQSTLMSNPLDEQTRFVTCYCQRCNGGIEFDSTQLDPDEKRSIECPHCKQTTDIFVPPDPFEPIMGQRCIMEYLKGIIEKSQRRKTAVPHVLIEGAAQCGKTTLALCFCNALIESFPGGFKALKASELGTFNNLISFLVQRKPGELIFLDDIESADESILPTLATAMADFKIILGPNISEIPHFVAVATANTESNLPPLIRRCFPEIVKLEQYSEEDISRYATRVAQVNHLGIDEETLPLFCAACASPAQVRKLMERARTYLKTRNSGNMITKEVMAGITETTETRANNEAVQQK